MRNDKYGAISIRKKELLHIKIIIGRHCFIASASRTAFIISSSMAYLCEIIFLRGCKKNATEQLITKYTKIIDDLSVSIVSILCMYSVVVFNG